MLTSLLRLAYICEFLLAMLAISVVWGQVGGQGHLDLMPWYDKLTLIAALAAVTVQGTAAAVSREKAWNGVTFTCLVAALLIAGAMGALTYYYHLHEDDESSESDTGVATIFAPREIRAARSATNSVPRETHNGRAATSFPPRKTSGRGWGA
jgi:hypothetical protein